MFAVDMVQLFTLAVINGLIKNIMSDSIMF